MVALAAGVVLGCAPIDHRSVIRVTGRGTGPIWVIYMDQRLGLRIIPGDLRNGPCAAPQAAMIKNDDVRWHAYACGTGDAEARVDISPETASAALSRSYTPEQSTLPLFEALSDRRQFIAAHVLLVQARMAAGVSAPVEVAIGGDPVAITYDGLRVTMCEAAQTLAAGGLLDSGGVFQVSADGAATADPAQIRPLLDLWSYRLGKPVVSVDRRIAGGAVCAVSAAYLLLKLRREVAPRLRRRRGLCPTCGYDLRGSPSGCSECGAEKRG